MAKRPILKLFLISFAICFVLMIAGIIAAVIMTANLRADRRIPGGTDSTVVALPLRTRARTVGALVAFDPVSSAEEPVLTPALQLSFRTVLEPPAVMKVLVENRSSFTISIVREHTTDLDRTVRVLSQVAGLNEADVRDLVNRHRREPSYRPIVVVEDATLAQVAAVLARRLENELPDVDVAEAPTRRYPANAMAAHLFGYVGEASETQVASDGLQSGAIVGQSGVEKVYNKLLTGEDGARVVVVNSMARCLIDLVSRVSV